jgi:hypothetical protein
MINPMFRWLANKLGSMLTYGEFFSPWFVIKVSTMLGTGISKQILPRWDYIFDCD